MPYKAVQQAENPEEKLQEFLDSTYDAGVAIAKWDKELWKFKHKHFVVKKLI